MATEVTTEATTAPPGMISSAILWGYLADTKDRKKLLVFGYLSNIISVFGGACSQNVKQLVVFKYISGFIMSGPFAVLMSYLSEMHGKRFRSRILMVLSIMFSIGNISMPLVALSVLPIHWYFQMLGLQFHSWQVFLAISTIPSLLGGTLLIFFPESPKFLMSLARNTEALRVFQKIYALNSRTPCTDFPVVTPASNTNNIPVAVTSFVSYCLAGFVINRIGNKILLTIGSTVAGLCSIGLYFSISSLSTSILVSISVTMGNRRYMAILSSSVELLPTSLRFVL